MKDLILSHRENDILKEDGCKNSTTGVIVINAYCMESGCSTSQLDVNLSPELNGLSVSCSVYIEDTNTTTHLGTEVLNVLCKLIERNAVVHVL